jgi:hypothetical protein
MGVLASVPLIVLVLLLAIHTTPSRASIVVFVKPDATCASSCDGTLARPFTTIKQAFDALAGLVSINTVVLLPGVYKGPNNTNLRPPNNGIYLTIRGWHYETTILDCEGTAMGFELWYIWIFMESITVANCVGSNGGGAFLHETGLFLSNTRWVNNSATTGGAIYVYWGGLTLVGPNYFINNSAENVGGAIAGFHYSQITISNQEILEENVAFGNYSSSNFFIEGMDPLWNIQYPVGGFAPPLTEGMTIPIPEFYVDGSSDCSSRACDGSITRPYNMLQNVTWPAVAGGVLYIMPGIYKGPGNTNLTWANSGFTVSRWPNTTSPIIIDCENQAYGVFLYNLNVNISDLTFMNCQPMAPEIGGGAILADYTLAVFTDTHFIGNSAPQSSGGALFTSASAFTFDGGSYVNNSGGMYGGAVGMDETVARFTNSVKFSGNTIYPLDPSVPVHNDDLFCANAEVLTDGSVELGTAILASDNCTIALSSPSTSAVFPGYINGILYPKNSSGAVVPNVFAALSFDSVVELTPNGTPIESTRLTAPALAWTSGMSQFAGYVSVNNYAFGPAGQYIEVTHSFFLDNSTYQPLGSNQPIEVMEGVIKTSVQIAMWTFQSASNTLAVTFTTNASSPVFRVEQTTEPFFGTTRFVFTTAYLTATFSALPYAVYDDKMNTRADVNVTARHFGTVVIFQFIFSQFELWMGYDPQFSVLLQSNSEQSESDTPTGLIAGLTMGLVVVAIIVSVVIAAVGTVLIYIYELKERRRLRTLEEYFTTFQASSDAFQPSTKFKLMEAN